jgi:erythromycin esterase-like protein
MAVAESRGCGLAQRGDAIFGSEIMVSLTPASLVNSVRQEAQPLLGTAEDYNPLLDLIGDSPIVLLGEASHGTHEFYRVRADITRQLIQEKGFNAVAVETDWPDAYRVNRYVQGVSDDATSVEALADFKRFPAWMWRNADVLDFVGWLYSYNASSGSVKPKVGFYGLDLYSLYTSIEMVLKYLDKVDLEAASRARYGIPASSTSAKTRKPMGTLPVLALVRLAATKWLSSWWNCARRLRHTCRWMGGSPPMNIFMLNRMPA